MVAPKCVSFLFLLGAIVSCQSDDSMQQLQQRRSLQTTDTPSVAPTAFDPLTVCALQRNTDQCAEVTEFVNPIEDCDCYNFCEGVYTGCCNFAVPGVAACTASCPTSSNTNDIVAGCEIDPSKPPVNPPPIDPSEAPTAAPPTCRVQLNTQNCPQLTENQLPMDGCDCYNYCGDVFAGCCTFDSETCSASCIGNQIATIGCQLPEPTCRGYGATCSVFSDCCSDRCLFKTCQRPADLADTKTKLSDGLGGAAGVAKNSGVRHLTKDKVKIRGM
jgi:hypothetical protein